MGLRTDTKYRLANIREILIIEKVTAEGNCFCADIIIYQRKYSAIFEI